MNLGGTQLVHKRVNPLEATIASHITFLLTMGSTSLSASGIHTVSVYFLIKMFGPFTLSKF